MSSHGIFVLSCVVNVEFMANQDVIGNRSTTCRQLDVTRRTTISIWNAWHSLWALLGATGYFLFRYSGNHTITNYASLPSIVVGCRQITGVMVQRVVLDSRHHITIMACTNILCYGVFKT